MAKGPVRPKRCSTCKKIIAQWSKSGLCTYHLELKRKRAKAKQRRKK